MTTQCNNCGWRSCQLWHTCPKCMLGSVNEVKAKPQPKEKPSEPITEEER
jgi:hypothetical protein